MVKVVLGAYGLVMKGCSPPVLTISVSYSSSSQKKNNIAHDLYDGYAAPYEGQCNMKREGNGHQNPVPPSRRLLAESPTSRRSLLSAQSQQNTCYRRVVTIVSAIEELGAKCQWVNYILSCTCTVADQRRIVANPSITITIDRALRWGIYADGKVTTQKTYGLVC